MTKEVRGSTAGEDPPQAAGNDSPDPNKLDEEERASIRRVLRQAGMKPTAETVERLFALIQKGMDMFREARAAQRTYRERHDAIRELLHLAEEKDPSVALIRKRIRELAPVDVADAAARATRLWPRVFPGENLESASDFVAWSQTAPKDRLLEAVRTFFSDGGMVVRGRARPGGRRSRARPEPIILGQVRGAVPPSRRKADAPTDHPVSPSVSQGNGRPRANAADDLVMYLALDWNSVTGHAPKPGRSDQRGFGALVYHVFGWLGIETADQSLRRYWDVVLDAEIIPTEGRELRR